MSLVSLDGTHIDGSIAPRILSLYRRLSGHNGLQPGRRRASPQWMPGTIGYHHEALGHLS